MTQHVATWAPTAESEAQAKTLASGRPQRADVPILARKRGRQPAPATSGVVLGGLRLWLLGADHAALGGMWEKGGGNAPTATVRCVSDTRPEVDQI